MLTLVAVALLALGTAACMPAEERTFLDRTNAMRTARGIPALAEQQALTDKAERWAQHMAATGTLAHSSLTADLGGLAWARLAENVAVSTPTADPLLTLHELVVSSAGHRQNLLDPGFTHMGVGFAVGPDGRAWVAQVFARL